MLRLKWSNTVEKFGVLIFLWFFVGLNIGWAAIDVNTNPVAQQSIDKDELKIRLVPLTKDDLTVVADHWMDLLQQQLQKNSELKVQAAALEAGAQKDKLLGKINEQNEKRIKLVDKLNFVLTELQKKGGDVEGYKTYVRAVSGPQVDKKDSSAVVSALAGWLKSPEGGIRWGTNIGFAVLILIVFWILAGIFGNLTGRAVNRLSQVSDLLKQFFVHSVQKLTKIIGVMIALSMLEINIGPLIAALGAVGFIVGFALQGTLSNFASGLMILIYRPYDLGNVVNVAGVTGSVSAMTLVSTTLKLPDNQVVVIPNNSIWGSTITNITGSETRRVDMVFGVGYSDDIEKTEQVLADILNKHPLILDDPAPVIKVHELADSSVNFVVRPWANTGDYFTVYWDVTRAVKQRFDEEGISIPYPQQDVHLFNPTS